MLELQLLDQLDGVPLQFCLETLHFLVQDEVLLESVVALLLYFLQLLLEV